jgi:hypothetical protein
MKRLLKGLSIALLLVLCTTISVQAVDSWKWYQDITITDTGGSTRSYPVEVLTGIRGNNLVTGGYISGNAFNARMQTLSNTDLPFMVDTINTGLVIPSLVAYQAYVARFYYGYSPGITSTPIVLGNAGYITTSDTAALEPGNSFNIEINGYINVSYLLSYLMNKDGAVGIHTTLNSGEIAVKLNGADVLTVAGQTSGLHNYIITLTGGTLTFKDGVTTLGSVAFAGAVVDNANAWVWLGPVVPYANSIYYGRPLTTLLWYQPRDAGGVIVQGTTMKDRQNTYDGVITWGTNSSLDVSVGPIVSYQSNTPAGGVLPNNAGTLTQPTDWYASNTAPITLPFYDSFNTAAVAIGMTTQTLYVIVAMGIAVAAGLGVLVLTGSTLIATAICGIVISSGVSAGVLSGWMLLIFLIMGGGLLFLSRQV